MGKVNVVLNESAVRQLLKSPEMKRKCMDVANKIAGKCGAGYEVQERNYPERSGAIVLPTTYQAKRDNKKNGTISNAVGQMND